MTFIKRKILRKKIRICYEGLPFCLSIFVISIYYDLFLILLYFVIIFKFIMKFFSLLMIFSLLGFLRKILMFMCFGILLL